ncbi:MAG: portal protein, partial [Pseudomonadota bacterium]|nr:portal protein [Pseudomonadota bacterium]
RKRFAQMFNDLLKTQLILKNIVTPEDWEKMREHIQYDFLYDNQFSELKESELMNERLATLATIEPYIGKYYSNDYVRRKILRQTDSEILEIDEQIEQEIRDGIIPDPEAVDPITGEPLPQGDLGDIPQEPDLEKDAAVTDAQLAKDTKSMEI